MFSAVGKQIKYDSRLFANTREPGTALLDGSFISSSMPISGDLYNKSSTMKGLIWPTFESHIFRDGGDDAGMPPLTELENLVGAHIDVPGQGQRSTHLVRDWARILLERLYKSFARQGPERQMLVELIKDQDRTEHPVHFLIGQNSKSIGHAQVFVTNRQDPLTHIEHQWGLRRSARKKGEMGRLSFMTESEMPIVHQDPSGILSPQTTYYHKIAELTLWQQTFTWSSHDADLDELSFQINDGVKTLLTRLGIPLHLGEHQEKFAEIEGMKIRENLYFFDRKQLREVEAQLMLTINKMRIERMLQTPEEDAQTMILRFARSEIPALRETNLFDFKSFGLPVVAFGIDADPAYASIPLPRNTIRFYSVDLGDNDRSQPFAGADLKPYDVIEIVISRRMAGYLHRNLSALQTRLKRLQSIDSLAP